MDQEDAEILERVGAGERIFRPGLSGEEAPQIFEALVKQLRALRDRGLVDIPERGVAFAVSAEANAGPRVAGPCDVTEAGRAALRAFRQATDAGMSAGTASGDNRARSYVP